MAGPCPVCGDGATHYHWRWSCWSLLVGFLWGMSRMMRHRRRHHFGRFMRIWCTTCGYAGPPGWAWSHGYGRD
jgi:hypothetical protein